MKYLILISMWVSVAAGAQKVSQYMQKPKLTVVIVIDQLRADYLTRFFPRFLPAQQNNKTGGFRYLMEKGAYFPFAEYDVLQNMTCPGHAAISTGSRPHSNGITLNEWYDQERGKMDYCAEDDKDGLSPRRLKTTTFSDEYKNISPSSKVVAVALKDRSAIMLGGYRADLALWMNLKNWTWESSTYYSHESLPTWVRSENAKLKDLQLSKAKLSEPTGIQLTMELAIQALKEEKLGQGSHSDFLMISLSSHDIAGHMYGMHSPQLEQLTLAEDRQIAQLLQTIDQKVGLKNALIALTADHGIPPNVETTLSYRMESGKFDYMDLFRKVNHALDEKFGSAGSDPWLISGKYLHLYLNRDLLKKKKLQSEAVEKAVKSILAHEKGVLDIITKTEIQDKNFPLGLEQIIANSVVSDQWGDVVIIPEPFFMEKDENVVTHMTQYSYDRTVPLLLVGPSIHAGVYAQKALVIDLAPTLSFILGSVPAVKNEGHVLSDIF